jgi:hypothetical protein
VHHGCPDLITIRSSSFALYEHRGDCKVLPSCELWARDPQRYGTVEGRVRLSRHLSPLAGRSMATCESCGKASLN